ncbi:hypothetical protein EV702DRAFT_947955, partial [Suillus placidus]
KHLHHLCKSDSPPCPHCPGIDETVYHHPLKCLHFQQDCHSLVQALGHRATSIQLLLTNPSTAPTL